MEEEMVCAERWYAAHEKENNCYYHININKCIPNFLHSFLSLSLTIYLLILLSFSLSLLGKIFWFKSSSVSRSSKSRGIIDIDQCLSVKGDTNDNNKSDGDNVKYNIISSLSHKLI